MVGSRVNGERDGREQVNGEQKDGRHCYWYQLPSVKGEGGCSSPLRRQVVVAVRYRKNDWEGR